MSNELDRRHRSPGSQRDESSEVGTPGKYANTEMVASGAIGPMPNVPGKRAATEMLPSAPVQRRATSIEPRPGASTADVQSAADHGVSGAAGALPHLDLIQTLFGRHDVSRVHAHTDDAASQGAAAMGAQAFATGDHVAFAGSPDLHTAAHEAAHVVQQRGGVQLEGGVGEVGDPYERHADEVADRVVRGQSAEDLLDRSSGHASTSQITAGGAVQRKIPHQVAPAKPFAGVSDYVTKFDAAVDKAYKYVLHVPTLGAYKDLDGYTQQWVETWELHTKGTPHPMMAAHFGYAVETLATIVYLPAPPGGLVTELQGPRGATRPDVILKNGATDVAWLDITADGSQGHIWDKAGWDKATVHVAEVTYPSMNVVHFNPTADYKDDVDQHEFLRRKFWAEKILEIRKSAWVALGLKFKAPRGGEPIVRQNTLPKKVMDKLAAHFGVPFDRPTAASVLTVMGVNPMTHCIDSSVSRARGMAFLLQNDPNLPSIEIPADGGVPRGLIPKDYAQHLDLLQRMEAQGALETDLVPETNTEMSVGSPAQGLGSDDQQLALVEDGQQMDARADSLALPEQHYELELPSLQLPPELFGQLNQYLMQNNFTFVLDLQGGPFGTQLVAEPGESFAFNLQAALAELDKLSRGEQEERPTTLKKWQKQQRRKWNARLTFVPHHQHPRRNALRGPAGQRLALQPPPPAALGQPQQPVQNALVPFAQPSPPPFLQQLFAFQKQQAPDDDDL